jgi:hypothetical protein
MFRENQKFQLGYKERTSSADPKFCIGIQNSFPDTCILQNPKLSPKPRYCHGEFLMELILSNCLKRIPR